MNPLQHHDLRRARAPRGIRPVAGATIAAALLLAGLTATGAAAATADPDPAAAARSLHAKPAPDTVARPAGEARAVGIIVSTTNVSRRSAATVSPDAVTERALNRSAATLARLGESTDVDATDIGGGMTSLRFEDDVPLADAETVANRVADEPGVEFAVVDRVRTIRAASPTPAADEYFGDQWNLWDTWSDSLDGVTPFPAGGYGTHAPALWRATKGKSSVVVAVLDTGITAHPDLDDQVVTVDGSPVGYDFVSDATDARDGDGWDPDPSDEGDWTTPDQCGDGDPEAWPSSWHGTHVAGIVAAKADTTGVVGNAPGVRILPVRVLAACGGTDSDILAALTWATGGVVDGVPVNPTPASVVNLSLGGGGTCDAAWTAGIAAARARGAVVVVAAGNEAADAGGATPASCTGAVTVAATDDSGQQTSYTNTGSVVDVAAPGGEFADLGYLEILSTVNAGTTTATGPAWGEMVGTSMAAPGVAGGAGLLRSLWPSASVSQIESALRTAVQPFPEYGGGYDCAKGSCGTGIIDLARVPVSRSTPTITGTLRPGSTLTARSTWIGTSKLSYQWLRDGVAIAGATASTRLLTNYDVGHHLSVSIAGSGFPLSRITTTPTSTVPKVTSAVKLATSRTTSTYGSTAATLTATVSIPVGSVAGKVTFKDGTRTLRTVTVSGGHSGTAKLALGTTSLAPGARSVTATFAPTSTTVYGSATSGATKIAVAKGRTSTKLTSSRTTSRYGVSAATLTAKVGGATTGKVTFKDGTRILGTVTASKGAASLRLGTRSLSVGKHALTATFVPTSTAWSSSRSSSVSVSVVR